MRCCGGRGRACRGGMCRLCMGIGRRSIIGTIGGRWRVWADILDELRRGCDEPEGPDWTVAVDGTMVRAHQQDAGARHALPAHTGGISRMLVFRLALFVMISAAAAGLDGRSLNRAATGMNKPWCRIVDARCPHRRL
jgi:hypothetical protein